MTNSPAPQFQTFAWHRQKFPDQPPLKTDITVLFPHKNNQELELYKSCGTVKFIFLSRLSALSRSWAIIHQDFIYPCPLFMRLGS
jgi:hypothetical protein